jgi:hypothetical protein
MDAKIVDRFMSKVEVNEASGCWEWTAGKFEKGYGQFKVNKKPTKAHRVSYEMFIGTIGKGLCVCHRCDNPGCVNPYHLFKGTHKQNSEDMVKKGRSYSKLEEKTVLFIRKFLKRKGRGRGAFLARWFGVDTTTISKVKHYKQWRHV